MNSDMSRSILVDETHPETIKPVNAHYFKSIQKRDGRVDDFDLEKIVMAIYKAAEAVGGHDMDTARRLANLVVVYLRDEKKIVLPAVEEVQDAVEKILIENGHAKTAKAYILYRDRRTRIREGKSELMDAVAETLVETNRENANVGNSPSAKMLQIASAASRQYYLSRLIPEDIAQAHINGDIHIHDLDFYAKTLTCVQIPLGRLLHTGFDTGHGYIRPPKRPSSAAALAAIILQSSQNDMHGGQSFAFFDRDMADFVDGADENEVYQAMEGLVYNLNSMHSRAGAQVPFSSINLGCDTSEAGRLVTRSLLQAYARGLGRGETPIFPNIIFRVKSGVNLNPGDPNYDLFQLAIQTAATRMNPTFSFMDAPHNKPFNGEVAYMGCRTRVIADRHGNAVSDGRGNLSFTSINLPRIALKSNGDVNQFYRLLEETLTLVARQLMHRYQIQAHLKVKDMPFLMGQALYVESDQLQPYDEIARAIRHGTLSIGFIGLAETLTVLTGANQAQSQASRQLGLEIVRFMRRMTDFFADQYDLNFTLLATPAEGLSGRFLGIDKKVYGIIPGVTDKDYYTNSFHVPVSSDVTAYEKMSIEAPYHEMTNAGHISYVELDAPPVNNLAAFETVIRTMGQLGVGYGGINFPIDECRICGYRGLIDEECPTCGSQDIRRIRRITGYLSTVDRFNAAKQSELHDRHAHLH
ncbi:ribonucleoside-triphosphate reductase class III catalytic subunit [Leptolinea tardivitalis]|nr:ribonucleoside-triphosphate reductase class III catalytic subunit [Leptolinea tardivitalis]